MKALRALGPLMRLPDGLVRPRYDGAGLVNVPHTVLQHLARLDDGPALTDRTLPPQVLDGVARIVLVVVDGLGWDQAMRLRGAGGLATLSTFEGGAVTSVAPSTTASALTSLATGLPPAAHGVLGYRMHVPDLGTTVNMVSHEPMVGTGFGRVGFDAGTFVPFPTVHERLAKAGVAATALVPAPYVDSSLSRTLYKGLRPSPFVRAPDMLVGTRRWLGDHQDRAGFLSVYYDAVDTVAHAFGPESPEHDAEVTALDRLLATELVDRVDDPGTLVVVTADHGHVTVPPDRRIPLADHRGLLDHLVLPPTGEGRLLYLHARPGHVDDARAYVEEQWPASTAVWPTEEAVDAGVFGDGPRHPDLLRRLGDLVVAVTDDHLFEVAYGDHAPSKLVGNHGGLTPAEMMVPLLWKRL